MKKTFIFILMFVSISHSVFAADTAETVFILSDDLKSAVSYFNKRSNNFGNLAYFFTKDFDRSLVMYARPENYAWETTTYDGTDYEKIGFPSTNTYAYLQRHISTESFLNEISSRKYRLYIDGSMCMSSGCSMDENIIVAVLPKKFKVIRYKASVEGNWKIVGNTYTFYSRNVEGASIEIEFEDTAPYVYNQLAQVLSKFRDIKVNYDGNNVQVTMPLEGMFGSGQAAIQEGASAWLDAFADTVKKADIKELRVEGHSDNIPIKKSKQNVFPSNWELSAARSASVVRYFVELGIDPKLLAAVGYADSRPVDSNASAEGRRKNRRIEFTIVPDQDQTPKVSQDKEQWNAF